MSGATAQRTGTRLRRWRLFRASKLPIRRAWRPPAHDQDEVLAGHCPGCGGQVRFSAAASPVYRCPHCETPLFAAVGGLDVETAVQSRLYRVIYALGEDNGAGGQP